MDLGWGPYIPPAGAGAGEGEAFLPRGGVGCGGIQWRFRSSWNLCIRQHYDPINSNIERPCKGHISGQVGGRTIVREYVFYVFFSKLKKRVFTFLKWHVKKHRKHYEAIKLLER